MKKSEFLHLSDKLDVLDERIDGIDKILAVQEQNLQIHMKRSELLEAQVEPLNKFMWAAYGIIGFLVFVASVMALKSLF